MENVDKQTKTMMCVGWHKMNPNTFFTQKTDIFLVTYPPCDSDALRGEGFKLHILRWSIRS